MLTLLVDVAAVKTACQSDGLHLEPNVPLDKPYLVQNKRCTGICDTQRLSA